MKTSTSTFRFDAHGPGVDVQPDLAELPIRIDVRAGSPSDLPEQIAALQQRMASAVGPDASVELAGYRSWTEKLGGKSLFGRGVRYVARATGRVCLPMAPDADFLQRTRAVEAVRATVETLSDEVGAAIQVGECAFRVSDAEQHRPAVLAQLQQRLTAACPAFGLAVERLDLGSELTVDVRGPALARIRMPVTAVLGSS